MKTGIELIADERQEQIEKHGRSIEDDVLYNDGKYVIEGKDFEEPQLPNAAGLLLLTDHEDILRPQLLEGYFIPYGWNKEIWLKMLNKPYKDRLIIAGALIAAELDRLQYSTKS